MASPLKFTPRIPKKLLEARNYTACIDGYVVVLNLRQTRFSCEISREGFSATLQKLLSTRSLWLARQEHTVELGTLRNIKEWVESKQAFLPGAPRRARAA